MQTSFIPKKPVVETRVESGGISLFLLLAIIIFIVTSALSVGIWFWQKKLANDISVAVQALASARASYEEKTINEMLRLDDRIKESKKLLNQHTAITPVFALLEANVLRNVQLKSLKFSQGTDGKINIDLSGVALDYDALLRQSNAFGSENLRDLISQPVISDFNPTADGRIAFNFKAFVNRNLISYSALLDSVNTQRNNPGVDMTATTTVPE